MELTGDHRSIRSKSVLLRDAMAFYSLLLNFCPLAPPCLRSHWSRLGCVPQGWSQVSWRSESKMHIECVITCWFLRHPSFVRSSSILNTIFHSFPIFTLWSSHVILHNGSHLSHSPLPGMIHGVWLSTRQGRSSIQTILVLVKDGEKAKNILRIKNTNGDKKLNQL